MSSKGQKSGATTRTTTPATRTQGARPAGPANRNTPAAGANRPAARGASAKRTSR